MKWYWILAIVIGSIIVIYTVVKVVNKNKIGYQKDGPFTTAGIICTFMAPPLRSVQTANDDNTPIAQQGVIINGKCQRDPKQPLPA